jgi:UDPglucose--hexose-1-phosphate uridylyltransferase
VLVVQPYAASVPHQTLLLPDDRSPDLTDASDEALIALAETLPRVLAGIAEVLDDPAYNMVVHPGPPDAGEWYRWHVVVYPRVTTLAGLEIATGVAVNPATPEDTAPALRRAVHP